LLGHDLLGVGSPALDERPAVENSARQGRRLKLVGVRQLQVVAGHRLMERQVVEHVAVVGTMTRGCNDNLAREAQMVIHFL